MLSNLDGLDSVGEAQYATLRDLAGCRRRVLAIFEGQIVASKIGHAPVGRDVSHAPAGRSPLRWRPRAGRVAKGSKSLPSTPFQKSRTQRK